LSSSSSSSSSSSGSFSCVVFYYLPLDLSSSTPYAIAVVFICVFISFGFLCSTYNSLPLLNLQRSPSIFVGPHRCVRPQASKFQKLSLTLILISAQRVKELFCEQKLTKIKHDTDSPPNPQAQACPSQKHFHLYGLAK